MYWIRPEVAMWRTLDVIKMKDVVFKKTNFGLGLW